MQRLPPNGREKLNQSSAVLPSPFLFPHDLISSEDRKERTSPWKPVWFVKIQGNESKEQIQQLLKGPESGKEYSAIEWDHTTPNFKVWKFWICFSCYFSPPTLCDKMLTFTRECGFMSEIIGNRDGRKRSFFVRGRRLRLSRFAAFSLYHEIVII